MARTRERGHTRRRTGASALAALAAVLLVLGACSGGGTDAAAPGDGPGTDEVSGEVVVFAAASLQETFETLGERFEKAHPGTTVTFGFGGSDALAASIAGGAPADVFASASPATMRIVTDAGAHAAEPVTFARNRLEIATAPGNPERITSLADLAAPGLEVVLCDRAVPCGAAAGKALEAAGVRLAPASYEEDVRSALTKVVLKEADAALVYATDVRAAGDTVEGVEFPESADAVNDYPIARLEGGANPAAARAFVELVLSREGREVLTAAGFLAP